MDLKPILEALKALISKMTNDHIAVAILMGCVTYVLAIAGPANKAQLVASGLVHWCGGLSALIIINSVIRQQFGTYTSRKKGTNGN